MVVVSAIPALWFTDFFIRDSWQLYRAQNWPAVEAVVRSSVEDTRPDDENEGYGSAAIFERIEYAFTINGSQYVSRRVGPFERWNIGKHTVLLHKNKTVTAWVNPKNAYESILIRERRFGFYAVMTLAILFNIWFAFALLSVFVNARYQQAFFGHILTLIAAGLILGAIIADDAERTIDWYIVVCSLFGTLAMMGISLCLAVWFKFARYVAGVGLVAGFIGMIVGAALQN